MSSLAVSLDKRKRNLFFVYLWSHGWDVQSKNLQPAMITTLITSEQNTNANS